MNKKFYKDPKYWIILSIVFLVFLLAIPILGNVFGNTQTDNVNTDQTTEQVVVQPSKVESSAVNPIKINADELYKEYSDNVVAADLKYKDKLLEVTGSVNAISKDSNGDPNVTFAADVMQYGVNACFYFKGDDNKQIQLLAQLSPGQTVTIKGDCQGESSGILSSSIDFKDSEITNIEPIDKTDNSPTKKSLLKQIEDGSQK